MTHNLWVMSRPFYGLTDKPALQTDVHQPELWMKQIVIEIATLACFVVLERGFTLTAKANRPGVAWLDTFQDADQSIADRILYPQLTHQLFLRCFERWEINPQSLSLLSILPGVLQELIRQPLRISRKVLKQDSLAGQEDSHSEAQHHAKQDAIVARKSSQNVVIMTIKKTLHDWPPALMCFATLFCRSLSWSVTIFGLINSSHHIIVSSYRLWLRRNGAVQSRALRPYDVKLIAIQADALDGVLFH
jgi:hypothetical protein